MNDAFRLISMYVGDFDCLKKQMINFCSGLYDKYCQKWKSKEKIFTFGCEV